MSMHSVELALRDLLAVEVARVRTVSETLTESLVVSSASLGAVLGDSLDSVWTQPEVQGLPHHGAQGRVLANAALREGTAMAAKGHSAPQHHIHHQPSPNPWPGR